MNKLELLFAAVLFTARSPAVWGAEQRIKRYAHPKLGSKDRLLAAQQKRERKDALRLALRVQ